MIVRIGFSKSLALSAHLAALLPILAYALHHLTSENKLIGLLLILSSIFLLISTYMVYREKENDIILQIFVFCITLTLVVTCYYLGVRGALFVFPLLSAYFYSFKYKQALIYSFIASILCMLAALNSIDEVTVARISLGLVLSIFFNASFAYLVIKQKTILEKEAMEDDLTGLLNRRSFNLWLNKELPASIRNNKLLALLYIDLDNFKRINDNYGHDAGDAVLKETSKRMQSTIRSSDVLFSMNDSLNIARLAGDEFCLVLTGFESIDDIDSVTRRLLDSLSNTYQINNLDIVVTASIGIAIAGKDGTTPEELLKNADAAMYQAKRDRRTRYQFFNEKIAKQINEFSVIEKGLNQALEQEQFYLVCMPIYHSNANDIAGIEILTRSNNELLLNYEPDKFIPVAEHCGLIYEIDLWVLKTALKHIAALSEAVPVNDLFFCINISAKELQNSDIVKTLKTLLDNSKISAEQIELEITETSLIGDIEKSVSTLNKLKSLGVKLSLDDFGTGYTAFNQISNYPVDTIKIDRSFTKEINSEDSRKKLMVNLISSLAKIYNLSITAEGIENKQQLDYLIAAGCRYLQGYYLSKPMSWEELETLLNKNN